MHESKTVLVLSDDASTRNQAEAWLREAGAQALVHNDTERAIPPLTELSPLFALVDVRPSSTNAKIALQTLRTYAAAAAVPLIGVGAREHIHEMFSWGVDDVLLHPLTQETLTRKFHALRLQRTAAPIGRRPPRKAHRICVADDDVLFRMRIGELLESGGYAVTYAASGLEVLETFDGKKPAPELLVLDWTMPRLDGPGVLESLRRSPAGRALPVVVVTGMQRDPTLAGALGRFGVKDLLDKSTLALEGLLPILDEYLAAQPVPRQALRVSYLSLAEFRSHDADPWDPAVLFNLSEAGAFVRTLTPARPGAQVEFRLLRRDDDPLTLSGKVAWAHPYESPSEGGHPPGMGLEFFDVPPKTRGSLDATIRRAMERTPQGS
ncbi:MAG: response regulator [Myxococcaceae bacterium]